MSRRSLAPVVPIGCLTAGWRARVRVQPKVEREITQDPSLAPVLQRALDQHAGKLHRILRRGGEVATVAYLRRGKRKNGCVIFSHCLPESAQLVTVVAFERVLPR